MFLFEMNTKRSDPALFFFQEEAHVPDYCRSSYWLVGPNGHEARDQLAVIGAGIVAIIAGRPTGVWGYVEMAWGHAMEHTRRHRSRLQQQPRGHGLIRRPKKQKEG